MHKHKKISKMGLNPSKYYFVDLHYHLGTRSKKPIDQIIDVIERSMDVIGITRRGKGWASTEHGGCEYTYDNFLFDVMKSKVWHVKKLDVSSSLISYGKREIIIVDTQETYTCDEIDILTIGTNFEKYESAKKIIFESDFSVLAHPLVHPINFSYNNIINNEELLKEIILETYNQAVKHVFYGKANSYAMKLANKWCSKGFTVSDSHNYYCMDIDTSGMILPKKDFENINQFTDTLKQVIVSDEVVHYKTKSLKDYLGIFKIGGTKDWKQVMTGEK